MSTTNKQLEQPAFNAYPNTWGTGPLNSNFGYIDTALGGSTSLNATGLGGTVVPLTNDQARPLTLTVTGTPGGIVTYEIPAGVGGQWVVRNGTTGGYDVRVRSASATGIYVTVPAGNNLQISCDGTATGVIRNSTAGVNAAAGLNTQVQYNSAGSLAGSNNLAFDGTTLYTAGFNNIGSTVLGDASGDILTINGTAVSIPNGLNIGSNTLYLAAGAQQVGIGTTSLGSNSLTVAGVVQSTAGGFKFPDGSVQTTAGGGGGGGISSITINTINLPNITVGGATTQTLTSNGTFILGGTLAISNGGTGQTTATAAFTALAPVQTTANGKYLKSNGTVADWAALALDSGTTVINGVTSGNLLTASSGVLGSTTVASLFPSQTGNSGKALITDGTNTSWGYGTIVLGTTPVTGTSTYVPYVSGGVLSSSANMTFNGTTLTVAGFSNTGNTILGDAGADTITINASTASIPNTLNFGSNTLYLSSAAAQVGIGTTSVGSDKLTVAGTVKSTTGGFVFPDATTQTTAATLPAGAVMPYAGSSAPSGWLFCAGQAVSRTTYAALFAAISTTYGSGDGSTTFNLPDLRGRGVAGIDNLGGSAAGRLTSTTMSPNGTTYGATGGTETATATTTSTGSATGSLSFTTSTATGGTTVFASGGGGAATGYDHYHTGTTTGSLSVSASGTSSAFGNVQPTLLMAYIIKT